MSFIWMLHIFCNGFSKRFQEFLQMFRTHVASVSNILNVNVLFGCFKSRSGVASPSSPSAASSRCLLFFSMLVMFERRGPTWGQTAWVGQVVRAA
jgi:hypothetical protein